MSLSLGTLTAYVDEHKLPLIVKSLYGGETAQLMNKQTGIKNKATINVLSTDAVFQADSGCSFASTGTTSITQRTIEVAPIKVNEDICAKSLRAYYTNKMLAAGSLAEGKSIPFEQEYVELKASTIATQLETAYWQGDTSHWNTNLKQFNGFIKLIDTAAASVNGNPTSITTGTGIVAANVVGIFNKIYDLIPLGVIRQSDTMIFCGTDVFRTYAGALTAANLFHYTGAEEGGQFTITLPGRSIKVKALPGLDGTNRIFAGRTSNFYIGSDLEDDSEVFEIWESKDDRNIKYAAEFKAGVQVAFPDEIVSFKLV